MKNNSGLTWRPKQYQEITGNEHISHRTDIPSERLDQCYELYVNSLLGRQEGKQGTSSNFSLRLAPSWNEPSSSIPT